MLIKKHVVRRTFKSKKNPDAPLRHKAPKIQRLVTDARLRRKKLIKKRKVDAWKKTRAAIDEYHKLCHDYFEKKKKQRKDQEKEKTEKKEAPKTETQQSKPQAPKPKDAKKDAKTTQPKTDNKTAKTDTKSGTVANKKGTT